MENEKILYDKALRLTYFTIIYNVIEGLVSTIAGAEDETLALFGFGIDSFIEVMSGIGILAMILRIRRNPVAPKHKFETTALKVTGYSFFILSAGLLVGIVINVLNRHKPATTLWGIIISLVSIAVMLWLMLAKRNVGRKLDSEPIICDSNCTKMCVYMSVVLLISSLVYELTGFAYSDAIGAAGLIWFSVAEGREALEKANTRFSF